MVMMQLLSCAVLPVIVSAAEAAKTGFPASHTALPTDEAEDYRKQFNRLDKNSDGKITVDEIAKAMMPPEEGDDSSEQAAPDPAAAQAINFRQMGAPSVSSMSPTEPSALAGFQDDQDAATEQVQQAPAQPQQDYFKQDLAFVHVPMTFGHDIERVALEGSREQETPFILYASFNAKTVEDQTRHINEVKGTGGQVWGQMYPELRQISNNTGCNLVYEPPKNWPTEIADAYFRGKRAFGLLRDPYDRLVSEFKYQVSGGGSSVTDYKRNDVSQREGSVERESPAYQALYSNCDVNGWVKKELKHYMAGDQFRGNCHLLPQAEYFEHPHGISLPIDTRTLPDSLNVEMERHGYTVQMKAPKPSLSCSKLSVWNLDAEAKQLIQEVYAADFELLCRHFGYCDKEELTCMAQFPFMCGAATTMKH